MAVTARQRAIPAKLPGGHSRAVHGGPGALWQRILPVEQHDVRPIIAVDSSGSIAKAAMQPMADHAERILIAAVVGDEFHILAALKWSLVPRDVALDFPANDLKVIIIHRGDRVQSHVSQLWARGCGTASTSKVLTRGTRFGCGWRAACGCF